MAVVRPKILLEDFGPAASDQCDRSCVCDRFIRRALCGGCFGGLVLCGSQLLFGGTNRIAGLLELSGSRRSSILSCYSSVKTKTPRSSIHGIRGAPNLCRPFRAYSNLSIVPQGSASLHPGLFCPALSALPLKDAGAEASNPGNFLLRTIPHATLGDLLLRNNPAQKKAQTLQQALKARDSKAQGGGRTAAAALGQKAKQISPVRTTQQLTN
jgi:hypothetical protein